MTRAKLEIREAAKLGDDQKRELADWLRMQADDLEADAGEYARLFTGSFITERPR